VKIERLLATDSNAKPQCSTAILDKIQTAFSNINDHGSRPISAMIRHFLTEHAWVDLG
jgi:hypothetical protein